jgi:uncharacterized RDD family membrane protein YckC
MTVPAPAPRSSWEQGLRPDPGLVGRPAGFWIRFVAYLIDGLVLGVVAAVLLVIFVVVAASTDNTPDDEASPAVVALGLALIAAFAAIGWLYEALLTSSERAATLGKMALGLRVVRADGARLSFGRATARYFLKVLITPMVPLFIGYLLAAFTTGKKALHDLLAETLVIHQGSPPQGRVALTASAESPLIPPNR